MGVSRGHGWVQLWACLGEACAHEQLHCRQRSLTHSIFICEVGQSLRVICEPVSLWKMLGIWY